MYCISEGDKIWKEPTYHNSSFGKPTKEMKCYTVKKVVSGLIHLKNMEWTIAIEEIGKRYFLSRRSAIMAGIRNNAKGILDSVDDPESAIELSKEVIRLAKVLEKELE